MNKLPFLFLISFCFISCSNLKSTATAPSPKLKLINTIEIPFNQEFKNTLVGGLSGIDYDAKNELYYILCDDRSESNLTRFYTAKIHLASDTIQSINFENVVTLKNEKGEAYGNWAKTPATSIDPEDIRYYPKEKNIIWCSEGARVLTNQPILLQNPAIITTSIKGDFINNYQIPSNLITQKENKGPRNNGALEGISFDKKYRILYTALESPLFEDGSEATTAKGGLVRLYQYDVKSRTNTAQYAYLLDAIAHSPKPENGFAINGISAIQFYDKNQLLIVERSYSVGKQACTIKVYLCDLAQATDVKNMASLQNQNYTLATKKLILNMDDLGVFVDNIEGITFGPKLSNGKQSLLFVTDNNFSIIQKTQILLFEVN